MYLKQKDRINYIFNSSCIPVNNDKNIPLTSRPVKNSSYLYQSTLPSPIKLPNRRRKIKNPFKSDIEKRDKLTQSEAEYLCILPDSIDPVHNLRMLCRDFSETETEAQKKLINRIHLMDFQKKEKIYNQYSVYFIISSLLK